MNKKNIAVLNISKIQQIFDKNKNKLQNVFDLKLLIEKKIVSKKYLKLKILGTGELKTKVDITAHFVSKQALEKVEKAGGKINIAKN